MVMRRLVALFLELSTNATLFHQFCGIGEPISSGGIGRWSIRKSVGSDQASQIKAHSNLATPTAPSSWAVFGFSGATMGANRSF